MLPFSSDLKLMGACMSLKEDLNIIYVKGASERVLGRCSKYLNKTGDNHYITDDVRENA
jgi:magnesium-transporting ATPase (P-type)